MTYFSLSRLLDRLHLYRYICICFFSESKHFYFHDYHRPFSYFQLIPCFTIAEINIPILSPSSLMTIFLASLFPTFIANRYFHTLCGLMRDWMFYRLFRSFSFSSYVRWKSNETYIPGLSTNGLTFSDLRIWR